MEYARSASWALKAAELKSVGQIPMHMFARTEEQELLAENLARLLREECSFEPKHVPSTGPTRSATAIWSRLAELGVLGAAIEPDHGGFAGDARTIAVIMAQLGRSLACAPFTEAAVIVGRILQQWADDSSRHAALESLMEGRSTTLLARSPSAALESPINVISTRRGDGIVLSGEISCVRYANIAESYLIPARDKDGLAQIYWVSRDSARLLFEEYRLIDGVSAANLSLREVELPPSACMSFHVDVQDLIADALEWGTLAAVAETAAILESLNSTTFSYLMTRRQFGALLGSFQALQHRAADMHIAAEESLAIVDETIDALGPERNPGRSALISAAKVAADTAAQRIGSEAVQLHGGMGVSDELIVSHYARRLVSLRREFGGADVHRLRFRSLQ